VASVRDFQSDSNGAVAWRPGKLWSLWDIMMNYQIFGFCHLLQALWAEEQEIRQRISLMEAQRASHSLGAALGIGISDHPTEQDRERIKGWLQYATQQADLLELQAAHDRISRFTGRLKFKINLQDYLAEVRALLEAFQDGIHYKYFYKYPQNKALVLLKFPSDWKPVLDKFAAAKDEVSEAIDCWAGGHSTACVFHLMRLAEHGLRAPARERSVRIPKKPLEWADWQNIIDGIRKKTDALAIKTAWT